MRRLVALLAASALIWTLMLVGTIRGATPCTLLVGYSQTQLFTDSSGWTPPSPTQWMYLLYNGGSAEQFADPSFAAYGWSSWSKTGTICTPTRVVLEVTSDHYNSDPSVLAGYIRTAIINIKARWAPNASTVYLISAVGGPGGQACPWSGTIPQTPSQPYVRASWNFPTIVSAIQQSGYLAGVNPTISACANYADWVGHWLNYGSTNEGPYVAQQVSSYFAAVDSGSPPPTPTPTPAPTATPTPTPTPTPVPTGQCVATWNGIVVDQRTTTQAGCGSHP